MEINIKKSIIESMKKESAEGILNIIDDALSTNDDVVLPGVGVLFLIYCNHFFLFVFVILYILIFPLLYTF